MLVLGGNALLMSAARAVLGDSPVVHLAAGVLWTTVAVGLLVETERLRPSRRRLATRLGWSMVVVGWLFAPVSRLPTGNAGAGQDLPWLSAGLLLALPLAYLGWRAVHRPGRRRRVRLVRRGRHGGPSGLRPPQVPRAARGERRRRRGD